MNVSVEGARLGVQVSGGEGAPALVLLHGFPLHGGMWSAQVEPLARQARVIVPDFRGFGASEAADAAFAIDFWVDDLFALLDSPELGLGGEPVAACGLSMGGYVLLRAVEREPKRFRALVLADTKSAGDNDEGRLKRLGAIRKIRREGAAAYAQGFADGALGQTTKAERPEVVRAVEAMGRTQPVASLMGAQLAMAARTDTTPALAEIRVPTLVLVGEEDTLTPPEAAEELAAGIGGARLVLLPGAGHLTPMEAPAAFTEALQRFLGGL